LPTGLGPENRRLKCRRTIRQPKKKRGGHFKKERKKIHGGRTRKKVNGGEQEKGEQGLYYQVNGGNRSARQTDMEKSALRQRDCGVPTIS